MVAFQNVLLTHKYTKYQWPHRSCHSRARTFAYPQGYYLLQCKSYWPHQRETPFQFQNSETIRRCCLKGIGGFRAWHGYIKWYRHPQSQIWTSKNFGRSILLQFKPHYHEHLYNGLKKWTLELSHKFY